MLADLVIKSYGGILDADQCKGEAGVFLRRVKKHLGDTVRLWKEKGPLSRRTLGKEVLVELIDTDEKLLFVVPGDDTYFIGVGAGLPLVLLDLFLTTMSHPRFFSGVGDIGQEKEWRKPPRPAYFTRCAVYSCDASDDLRTSGFWRLPNDLTRIKCAFSMCYDALEYQLYHEFAHLFRGHLRYVSDVCGHSEIVETLEIPDDPRKSARLDGLSMLELWQFFELDADRMAAELAFYPLVSGDRRLEDINVSELNRRTFAVTILMLAQHRVLALDDYQKSRYAHPIVRHRLQVGWTFSSTIGTYEISLDEAETLYSEFLTNLGLFSELLGRSIPLYGPFQREAVDVEAEHRREFYKNHLQTMSSKLEARTDWWRQHEFNLQNFSP